MQCFKKKSLLHQQLWFHSWSYGCCTRLVSKAHISLFYFCSTKCYFNELNINSISKRIFHSLLKYLKVKGTNLFNLTVAVHLLTACSNNNKLSLTKWMLKFYPNQTQSTICIFFLLCITTKSKLIHYRFGFFFSRKDFFKNVDLSVEYENRNPNLRLKLLD